jgi:hypothetical protein
MLKSRCVDELLVRIELYQKLFSVKGRFFRKASVRVKHHGDKDMTNRVHAKSIGITLVVALCFLGRCTPALYAQTSSCIRVTTADGVEVGVHSFNPFVADPNGCVDSLNGNIGLENGTNAEGNIWADVSSNVTIVSQVVTAVDDQVHCRFHGITGTMVGRTSGTIVGNFDFSSGQKGFQGHAVVTVVVTDSNGSQAPIVMDHLCVPSGGGVGLLRMEFGLPGLQNKLAVTSAVARPGWAITERQYTSRRSLIS